MLEKKPFLYKPTVAIPNNVAMNPSISVLIGAKEQTVL